MAKKKKKSSRFAKPTKEGLKKRSEEKGGGGNFDGWLNEGFKSWKCENGFHTVRLLPFLPDEIPEGEPLGYDLWFHWGIGPDNTGYLCPAKMLDDDCPICEYLDSGDATKKEKDRMRVGKSVGFRIIDRDDEGEGIQIWRAPAVQIARELSIRMMDRKTGEVKFDITDPDEGRDVEFDRGGKKDRTKYEGVEFTDSCEILDDEDEQEELLEEVEENTFEDMLHIYDYDHLQEALTGGSSDVDEEEEEEEEEEEPKKKKKKKKRSKDRR